MSAIQHLGSSMRHCSFTMRYLNSHFQIRVYIWSCPRFNIWVRRCDIVVSRCEIWIPILKFEFTFDHLCPRFYIGVLVHINPTHIHTMLEVCQTTIGRLRIDPTRLRTDCWRNDSLAKGPTFQCHLQSMLADQSGQFRAGSSPFVPSFLTSLPSLWNFYWSLMSEITVLTPFNT